MTQKTIFRLLAALIALMLMMPAAMAEPGDDTDLSGYNPFAGDVAESASAVMRSSAARSIRPSASTPNRSFRILSISFQKKTHPKYKNKIVYMIFVSCIISNVQFLFLWLQKIIN